MQSLDHGMLNVPLTKRGDINAQVDEYKAKQARTAAAARKESAVTMRANKALAKIALAELIAADGVLDAKATQLRVTRKALIVVLIDWAKWTPARVIKAHAEWMPA